MLEFGMNKILYLIVITSFLTLFQTQLLAGLIPDKIYKSIENKVKNSIGMDKEDYDQYRAQKEEENLTTPIEREAYLKEQFAKEEELMSIENIEKEEISIELEAIQFFGSLNKDTQKPVDME